MPASPATEVPSRTRTHGSRSVCSPSCRTTESTDGESHRMFAYSKVAKWPPARMCARRPPCGASEPGGLRPPPGTRAAVVDFDFVSCVLSRLPIYRGMPPAHRFGEGRLAQLVRAPPLQGGSRGFESLSDHGVGSSVGAILGAILAGIPGTWGPSCGHLSDPSRPRNTAEMAWLQGFPGFASSANEFRSLCLTSRGSAVRIRQRPLNLRDYRISRVHGTCTAGGPL